MDQKLLDSLWRDGKEYSLVCSPHDTSMELLWDPLSVLAAGSVKWAES